MNGKKTLPSELVYAGTKLVWENIRVLFKNTNKKSKPGWEIQLEIHIRNLRTQANMIKQRKNIGICSDKQETATQENITTWGNKPESTNERRKNKKIWRKGKTKQTKQDIPKQRKKILPTSSVRSYENIPTTECKRSWTILE